MSKMAAITRSGLHLSIRNAIVVSHRELSNRQGHVLRSISLRRSGTNTRRQLCRTCTTPAENFPTRPPMRRGRLTPKNESTESFLHLIDQEVRRVGRTTTRQVMTAYNQALHEGTMTNEHSVMLLRCLGSLLAEETAASRRKLVDEVWNKAPILGVTYDTLHYNALLKLYLENENKFSPADILAQMEANSITPNRVTYQRLVAAFCHEGDIQGASQILEHMKQNQLSINEGVFSALIRCHLKLGEEDKALNIFNVMRQAGMEPGADSYTALMQGYAEKGEIENMRKTMEEISANLGMLSPKNILDIVVTLAQSGNSQYATEMFEYLSKTSGYNQDAISCVYQLVGMGHDDLAIQLFEIMPKPVTENTDQVVLGRFLIRAMVKHERPVERVAELVADLQAKNYNSDGVVGTTFLALDMGKTDYTVELFKLMQKEGITTRTHFFWPLVVNNLNERNTEGIYRTMSMMNEMCQTKSDFIYTLHTYTIPALRQLGESVDSIVSRLLDIGFLEKDVNCAVFLEMLRSGQANEALEFVKGKPVHFIPKIIRPNLEVGMKNHKDVDSTLKILDVAKDEWSSSAEESVILNCEILMCYVASFRGDNVIPLIQGMRERDHCISKECIKDVETFTRRWPNQSEVMEAVHQLSVREVVRSGQKSTSTMLLADKTTAELEALLKDAESRSEGVLGIQKWLLSKYCAEGNVEAAESLMDQLSNKGFVYQADTLRQIIFMMATHKKDLQGALRYKEMMERQNPEYSSYVWSLFNLATLMVNEGKMEDAQSLMEKYASQHGEFMKNKEFDSNFQNQENVTRLLKACLATGNVEGSQQMMETLFDQGFIKSGAHSCLEAFMEGVVESDDSDKIISAMQYLSDKYERVVLFDKVFKFFIEKEDPDKLQKAMDLASSMHGEMNILHSLLFGFIETGKIAQARKILQTPGLRAIMPRLLATCDRFIKENKFNQLEVLVSETKSMFAIDRDEMLFHLIKAYGKQDDHKKALGVFEMYEEEEVQPRGRTLRFLANVLKRLDQPVPFNVPVPTTPESFVENVPVESTTDLSTLSAEEKTMFQLVVDEGINKFLEAKSEHQSSGQTLSPELIQRVGKHLFSQNKAQEFRGLCHNLADNGDVDSLLLLKEGVTKPPLVLLNSIFGAYITSGRAAEFLKQLALKPSELQNHVSSRNLEIMLEKCPDLVPEMESLVYRHTEETGKIQIINNLWTHYTIKDNQLKANEVLQKFPGLISHLRVAGVCGHAKRTDKIEMLHSLLDTVRHHNKSSLAFTYSYLIGTYCDKKDLDTAKSMYNQAKEDGVTPAELQQKAITDLSNLLKENNQQLLWQPDDLKKKVETKKATQQATSSSSSSDSSSSSESEDEATKA